MNIRRVNVYIVFPEPEIIPSQILHLDNTYNGTIIKEKVNLLIEMISRRIVLISVNWCGKTNYKKD